MPFPNQVGTVPAPAVEGMWASANPPASAIGGPGQYVAGPNGAVIGRFCWVDTDFDGLVNTFGTGVPHGFLMNHLQGQITTWLDEASMVIPPGQPLVPMVNGDFWVKNRGTTTARPGQKAYANYADGGATFAAAGGGASFTFTGSIAPATAIVGTASFIDNRMTVSAVSAGSIVVGAVITGTGVPTGTQVQQQLSGTPGGAGVYLVNQNELSIASGAIGGTYGTMTVTVAGSSPLGVGDVISGGSVTAGTTITALGTGTGGTGTYIVSPSQTQTSATLTAGLNVETKWFAANNALPGELVKITTHAPGA